MKKISKEQKLIRELAEYNRNMKRYRLPEKTMREYVAYKSGKSRYKPRVVNDPLAAKTLIRESPVVPSANESGSSAGRRESMQYTGDNLLGIGTMHKSNMVPVFKSQDAEDIAKMRRN